MMRESCIYITIFCSLSAGSQGQRVFMHPSTTDEPPADIHVYTHVTLDMTSFLFPHGGIGKLRIAQKLRSLKV